MNLLKVKSNEKEDIKNYLDLLWAMTEKEIKVRYKKAVFGFLWVVLNPLLQMLIIGFVFSFFVDIPNYFIFLFTGLLPWQFLYLSIAKTTPSFINERSLLQKAKFPKEIIPISIILANFINLMISLGLLIIVLLIIKLFTLSQIFLLIPAITWLSILVLGISLLTASLNVKYRDVNFFVQSLLMLWFYATPILYNISSIQESSRYLFALNPLTSIFELFHIALINQGVITLELLTSNLLLSVLIVFVGILTFKREEKYFVDRI